MSNSAIPIWKKLLFSKNMLGKNKSHQIAYIAVMSAFCVVANMYEIKFADTQFSLTIAVSALTGILIGPLFGFVACFLGDLVGFLYQSSGFAYMPFIGIAMGLTAFIFGGIFNAIPLKKKAGWMIKLLLSSLLSFLLCTILLNTTMFWIIYAPTTPYLTYLTTRLFIKGQIWSSLLNYSLLFVVMSALKRIKTLKIDID